MKNSGVKAAILTKEQNECVNYNSGDLLIRGVAGAGKSYVILKRAAKLHKEKKNTISIAIFTYTNSLVKYSNDLIMESLGENNILVSTVDSYCTKLYFAVTERVVHIGDSRSYSSLVEKTLEEHQQKTRADYRFYNMNTLFFEEEFNWIREKCIKEKNSYVNADRRGRGAQVRLSRKDKEVLWEIYALFRINAKNKNYMGWPDLYMVLNDRLSSIPEDKKFDYIFVDEAQDMTTGKMKVLKALAKNSITIAADVAQKIYKTSFTWKEVGIDITGRASKSLSKSFRSTKQIVMLAEDLMKVNRNNDKTEEYTDLVLPEEEGNKPVIAKFSSKNSEDTYVVNLLKEYNDGETVIGIIVRTENDINVMGNLLRHNGMTEYQVITKSKIEKATWSLLEPGIKIVKAHSSKGLEFDRVIIPNLNDSVYPYKTFKEDNEEIEHYLKIERNILYVAMTRARTSVVMTCQALSASRFIAEFNKDNYEEEQS